VQPEKVREILAKAKSEGRRFLPEPEAHAVLRAYGLPMSRSQMAQDETEAVRAAKEIGFPVVMKSSPRISCTRWTSEA